MTTIRRGEGMASCLKALIAAVNDMSEEDIKEVLQSLDREGAIGPLIDPTAFQSGAIFGQLSDTKTVMRALLTFKKEVKGIGSFT